MAKDPFKELSNIFKSITDGFKKMADIFKVITDGFKKLADFFVKIGKFFIYIGDVFKSIFSYIMCGFLMIVKIPLCLKWYSLDILGKTLYSPFAFLFFIFGLTSIEKMLWDIIYDIDCTCYSMTGFHIASFPDSVIKDCYSCKIYPIPKFPF